MTNEQINKHISKAIREIQNAGLTIAKNADKWWADISAKREI